ncbi:MAG TPA: amino acid adenylation domain-containing protein [Bacilli bacterium]|nr:amino acid adenylation domain-containing protein [Bacilli bacterium]
MQFPWNQAAAPYADHHTIHQLFQTQAARTPTAPAVRANNQTYSYQEIDRRSNQLAHALRARGCTRETFIGLLFDRSVDMVISLLGVLKAGGAYVPIDPNFPQARIDYLVADADPPLIITKTFLQPKLTYYSGQSLLIDQADLELSGYPTSPLPDLNTPDDLAYIIYTSGSTGKPKGTLLHHRGLCNLATAQAKPFHIHPRSRVLQFGSLSFDASVMEIFFPLVNGATLVLAPEDELKDPVALTEVLAREKITFVFLSPSMLSQLPLDAGPHLEIISAGGEPCPPALAKAWSQRLPFVNGYGPTECTVFSTAWISERDGEPQSPTPIGRPLPNDKIYILDDQLNPLPVGVQGEIYIGGLSLARGYHNRPDLTAERFLASPFEAGERIYQTGDLGRMRQDGLLEYHGRLDDQVKIRGYRVEVGEIEAVLSSHDQIREAAVIARPDSGGELRLLAYAVPCQPIGKKEIWNYLRDQMPTYMLPQSLLFLDVFPLTPTGKVDRKALPDPDELDLLDGADGQEYVAPRTALEQELADIWQEVLDIRQIGVHDHFFEHGAHSLKIAQFLLRVQERYADHITRTEVFQHPTIAELASLLERAQVQGAPQSQTDKAMLSTIPKLPPQAACELSHIQKRMWHLAQMAPDSSFYSVPMCFRLQGAVTANHLQTALQQLVDTHEIFRTTYALQGAEPVQIVHQQVPVELSVWDWEDLSENEQAVRLQELRRQEADRVFGLEKGPLFVTRLIRSSPTLSYMVLNVHHILIDGWSVDLVLAELDSAYRRAVDGNEEQPESPTLQFIDYAAWHNRWAESKAAAPHRDFWLQHLAGTLPVLDLPTDRPRPSVPSYRGGLVSHALDEKLSEQLRRLSQRYDLTMYTLLLGVFNVLLHRYSGQDDIIVGTPMGGRSHPEVEKMIGMFVNTVALRTDLSGHPSFETLLEQVNASVLAAMEHQEYPFDLVVEAVETKRDRSRNPVFSVMFVGEQASEQRTLGGLQVEQMPPVVTTSKFDLTLFMREENGRVAFQLEYAEDLFAQETAARLLGHLQELLTSVVSDPGQPISHLSLLPKQERQRLLAGLQLEQEKRVAHEERPMPCMQERWEAQVRRTPEHTAVTFAEQSLSYAELNARANRLAHKLRHQGVTRETPVVLLLERSLELVVAVLGVIKSGGVYIPVDPDAPDERLRYVCANSRAQVVVTQPELAARVTDVSHIFLDREGMWGEGESPDNPPLLNTVDDLLYILYTSGSTGQLKGVMLTHRNFGRLVDVTENLFRFHDRDVWTLFHSYCFDVSVWEMMGALLHGGRLVVVPKEIARSAEAFWHLLQEERVTVLNLTPSAFYSLQEVDAREERKLDRHLRDVIFAGESLQVGRLRSWRMRYPGRPRLVNMYGPTETVHATFHEVSVEDWQELTRGSVIGRPLADLRFYLLDQHQQLVAQGVTGEIYIAGPGVARSYLHLPDKTEAAFITSPLPECAGERWYRTGDLARWNVRGELEYLGRIDDQVKVRGYRVELGEIEAVLAEHEDVHHCAVVARPDLQGDLQVVAYVETDREERTGERASWRAFLQARLPEYMVPARFVRMEALPLNRNGKLDRQALPAPEQVWEREEAYVAPSSDRQNLLVDVWQDVLGLEKVGIRDDFFELGGHSLNMLPILVRVKAQLPTLKIQDFYTARTVEELCELFERREREGGEGADRMDMLSNPASKRAGLSKSHRRDPVGQKVRWEAPRTILLTGATGFLGAYVLRDLLVETDVSVTCLVRAGEEISARDRLVETMRFYFAEDVLALLQRRVQVIAGDLGQAGLGLAVADRKRLAEEIDAIVHCAADVRHYGTERQFERVNVEATAELLELARSREGVHVHYISTLGIAGWAEDDPAEFVFSELEFDRGQVLENLYARSKFEAEKSVREAMREGTFATVYRIGNLVGESRTGQFQRNIDRNAFYRMTKAMLLLEKAVDSPQYVDLTPIDYASRAVVQSVRQAASVGQTYHVCNPVQIGQAEFVELLQSCGYRMELMQPERYREVLFGEEAVEREEETLALLVAALEEEDDVRSVVRYDGEWTARVLRDVGIACPRPNREWMEAMLQYGVRCGFFPMPKSV